MKILWFVFLFLFLFPTICQHSLFFLLFFCSHFFFYVGCSLCCHQKAKRSTRGGDSFGRKGKQRGKGERKEERRREEKKEKEKKKKKKKKKRKAFNEFFFSFSFLSFERHSKIIERPLIQSTLSPLLSFSTLLLLSPPLPPPLSHLELQQQRQHQH